MFMGGRANQRQNLQTHHCSSIPHQDLFNTNPTLRAIHSKLNFSLKKTKFVNKEKNI
jgi:hypothetical protein